MVCVAEQDHEVQEEKIALVSLLMAELGVHSVAYAFPKVKIITTAVDKRLDDFLHVVPGIGKPPQAPTEKLVAGSRINFPAFLVFLRTFLTRRNDDAEEADESGFSFTQAIKKATVLRSNKR